jgi:hypothetical protein
MDKVKIIQKEDSLLHQICEPVSVVDITSFRIQKILLMGKMSLRDLIHIHIYFLSTR